MRNSIRRSVSYINDENKLRVFLDKELQDQKPLPPSESSSRFEPGPANQFTFDGLMKKSKALEMGAAGGN